MSGTDNQDVQKIADELVCYLERHPQAMDTVDGIVTWWIPRQRFDAAREQVERALASLEQQGEIRRRRMPDGRTLFMKSIETRKSDPELTSERSTP